MKVTKYNKEPAVEIFKRKLKYQGIPVFFHYAIPGYPADTNNIVSENGFGKNFELFKFFLESNFSNKRSSISRRSLQLTIDSILH